MSYNQSYEQDSGENVSYNNYYRLDVNRKNTLLPVIKGPKIPLEEMNPTYTFQISYVPEYIMPFELKAFNFDDIEINLKNDYTVISIHDGHNSGPRDEIDGLFDGNTVDDPYIWWNARPQGIRVYIGDQLFSVTIPTLPGDTLKDRQVKYFEITWTSERRATGLLILRNGVVVYDDGNVPTGPGYVIFTKRYDLPLPDILV
jgi:hypothetical protein